jgi:hypothetical protein
VSRHRSVLAAAVLAVLAACGVASAQSDPSGPCQRDGGTLVLAARPSTEVVLAPNAIQWNHNEGAFQRRDQCSPQGVTDIRVVGSDAAEVIDLDFAGRELPVTVALGGGNDILRFDKYTYDTGDRPAAIVGTGVVTADMGAGDDAVANSNAIRRLAVTLGEGDDVVGAEAAESLVVDGGPGTDEVDAAGGSGGGPWRVTGDAGRDRLDVEAGPRWTVFGNDGDDLLRAKGKAHLSCGPGDDLAYGGTTDATCPPQLTSIPSTGRYKRDGEDVRMTLRADRRARVTLSLRTLPPRSSKKAPVALVSRRTVSVGQRATRVVLPLTARGQTELRSRASARAFLLVYGVRAPGKTEGGRPKGPDGAEIRLTRAGG